MKNLYKVIIYIGCLLIALGILFTIRSDLYAYVERQISPNKYNSIGEINEYYRDIDFNFVQNTDNFIPLNKQDILNIYYTAINAGKEEFTFFCTSEFPDCLEVIDEIARDQDTLSDINNYVHPFNSFSNIKTEYDTHGRIKIIITHSYTQEDIKGINEKIDELEPELIIEGDTPYNNIKRIHDYIIDHAEYDIPRIDEGDKTYKSDLAYGPLLQGKAICSGYTDLMQLYLEKLNIPNFKVSSDRHIWNAVNIDGAWLNLDLTWDDPVHVNLTEASHPLLLEERYKYLLINTQQLYDADQTEHIFNTNNYSELIQ